MKKLVLPLLLLSAYFLSAQEEKNYDFNKWSIEVSGGFHKPSRPFADNYYSDTPSFGQVSVGTRYMFNNRFGLKLDFGYSTLKEGDNSLPYEANYYRGSLQGVANLGSIMKFESWTNTIGLLFHAGGGYSQLSPKKPFELDDNDGMMNIIAGITPQIKLGNRVALNTDLSVIGNVGQNYTWDGTQSTTNRGFDGMIVNFSAGLTFYLGANEKHADWSPQEDILKERLVDLEERLVKLETDLIDSDQDGVPDYLDREPNTMSGVAVDSKGVAVDKNKNGIPDEIEAPLDNRYLKKGDVANQNNSVEELLNKGYVNVYFKFNSDKPETYSLEAINYLMKYMKDNASAKAELIGYADELGNPEYNQTLSEKRAKRVYDILIASGISESRLTYRGGGEDSTVDKSSSPARQLVRRVTFRLK
ncbi:OmpA family protein [Aequorivita sp. CIP111184]|uniref:OmpA family protein n=1 Tax=Aequorivita sp. CIP111184 TaxID=2211356 RepID=UPI000DBBD3BC|nr:OmpA family protein [Aequorivita sp. CIP111184]SRX55890.1 Outer membrane porin F [Aequorivita sp. CIP111184]